MLRLLLTATALMSCSALASTPPAAPDAPAKVSEVKPKRVCTDIEVPGSNMKRRVCSKPKTAERKVDQAAGGSAN